MSTDRPGALAMSSDHAPMARRRRADRGECARTATRSLCIFSSGVVRTTALCHCLAQPLATGLEHRGQSVTESRMCFFLRALVAFVFGLIGIQPQPIHAQQRELFTVRGPAQTVRRPDALSSATDNRRWLVTPNVAGADPGALGHVRLPLGTSSSVVATLQVVDVLDANGVAYAGPVEGVQGGYAAFVSRDGLLTGAVYLPDTTYTLSPERGGQHVLEQLAPGDLTCGGGITPPSMAAPELQPQYLPSHAASASTGAATVPTIDLLVVHTADTTAAAGGIAAIRLSAELAVLQTNTALANSQVPARVRLVHVEELAYTESHVLTQDLARLTDRTDGHLDQVHALRDRVGADLVTLFVEHNATSSTGHAWLLSPGFYNNPASALYGFSVVMRRASNSFILAHELGHNLGLAHDRDTGGGVPVFPFAYGYRDSPYLRDIMAYPCSAAPCPLIPHFSNPRVLWQGRPTGREDSADNARALILTLPFVEEYRASIPPTLTMIEPAVGPTLGGIDVTLRGDQLGDVTEVHFGTRRAAIVTSSRNALTVRAPAHEGGIVDVTLIDAAGASVRRPSAYRFIATAADADADALPDDWERTFGLDFTSNIGDAGASGDPDEDGLLNLQEWERGGHPRGLHRLYFAEGATGRFFDTRFSLANPSPLPVVASLSFSLAGGGKRSTYLTIPPMARRTVRPVEINGLQVAEFSTVVETRELIAADRLMEWSPQSRFGSHLETAIGQARAEWYLAEGATHSGFDLFYLFQNPTDGDVPVEVTFLLPPPAAPLVQMHVLPANSRYTLWVNQTPALSHTDVSARIRTLDGAAIIVERSMYLSTQGRDFGAGHSSAGVGGPASRWYFAEGATGPYFDTFILIANPETYAVTVDATYLLPNGASVTRRHVVAATSRHNIWVDLEAPELADTPVSVVLQTIGQGEIVAERAMWWPGVPGSWTEAHVAAGATTAARRWVSSEGQQDDTHDTYILVANPQPAAATVRLTLMFEEGQAVVREFSLAGNSRTNVSVGAEFPGAAGRLFSTLVEVIEPGLEVVVERALYGDADGQHWAAGASALATRVP